MKTWNKAAFLLVAASLVTTPTVMMQPPAAYASIDKSQVEVIPLPADLVQVLKDLKEDYVPALGNLHTDSFVKEGSEYRIVLSDQKIHEQVGIDHAVTAQRAGNAVHEKRRGNREPVGRPVLSDPK